MSERRGRIHEKHELSKTRRCELLDVPRSSAYYRREPGSEVATTIPAGASRTFTAAALESGGEELQGALGDGEGKWRLTVESEQPLVVMSLLSDSMGHLTNLSTVPGREPQGPPDLVVVLRSEPRRISRRLLPSVGGCEKTQLFRGQSS